MEKKSSNFKFFYFIFLTFLIVLAFAAIIYVRSLLLDFEAAQPERCVAKAVDTLKSDAASGRLASKYEIPEFVTGKYEEGVDVKTRYEMILSTQPLDYSQKPGVFEDGELVYLVKSKGFVLAEVGLHAVSEQKTSLAVFTYRDWETSYVKPVFEAADYTLSVPSDFKVTFNGKELGAADGTESADGMEYKLTGVYMLPEVTIVDSEGNSTDYTIKGTKIVPAVFNYSLTLPASLSVSVNGRAHAGKKLDDGRFRHDIRLLTKPEVSITDLFGNTVAYEGGNDLALTALKLRTPSDYTVKAGGEAVPSGMKTLSVNPDYEYLKEYVTGLPEIASYDIAVLKNDVKIEVFDGSGAPVAFEAEKGFADLCGTAKGGDVPAEVSAEVNVLEVLEDWSLFMSNDLPFYEAAQYIIPTSYQYEVGTKYANGIDITFTSIHSLAVPPFSNEKVSNFSWITGDCFSVDVSFDKTMLLSDGQTLVDSMNERMYFAKYDATEDWVDNPTWMLASMKEIVDNAE